MKQELIRRRLRHVWNVFFGRFGGFSPVQVKAIPLVLDGKDVACIASTASGKTEAIVAPLIERLIMERWEPLSIVYISPTRALVNDIYKRLREQLIEFDISVSPKTGDKPYFKPDKPTDVLITTPESLDSLVCRHPEVFDRLRAIIIDEIHFLDNNYRGDQIRILLKRLKRIRKDFNTYLLSATVSSPEEVAARYTDHPYIVDVSSPRKIEYSIVPTIEDIVDYMKKEDIKKVLVFCNKKRCVEETASVWKKFVDKNRIVVHHGSLGKHLREEAEAFMKEANFGVCVSTMTLEIGIDIGDIDAVVLAEIPFSISSLLQRIGRANRRGNKIRVFGLYTNEKEEEMFHEMFKFATEGYIDKYKYIPDYSVVVQQVFSSLYKRPGGLGLDYFLDIFSGFCSDEILNKILIHLSKKGWITFINNKWHATAKLLDWNNEVRIHSNIPNFKKYIVMDAQTKKKVGEIKIGERVDSLFLLGGRIWHVVSVKGDKVYVKMVKNLANTPFFPLPPPVGFFNSFLPRELQGLKTYRIW